MIESSEMWMQRNKYVFSFSKTNKTAKIPFVLLPYFPPVLYNCKQFKSLTVAIVNIYFFLSNLSYWFVLVC